MAAHTPRIKSFAPQLLVDDIDRANAFYRDVLGFSFARRGKASTPSASATALRSISNARRKIRRTACIGDRSSISTSTPTSPACARCMRNAGPKAPPSASRSSVRRGGRAIFIWLIRTDISSPLAKAKNPPEATATPPAFASGPRTRCRARETEFSAAGTRRRWRGFPPV
jgi:hypothetical protein